MSIVAPAFLAAAIFLGTLAVGLAASRSPTIVVQGNTVVITWPDGAKAVVTNNNGAVSIESTQAGYGNSATIRQN